MPDFIQYLALGAGFVAMWSFGRIFVERDVGLSLLVGCLLVGGAISTVAWTFPFLTRPIVAVASVVGIVRLVYDWRRSAIAFELGWHAALTIVAVGVVLRSLEAHFYRFGGEDTLYWPWALELLQADYRGGLRHLLYFPYEAATNHLLPSAIAAALCVFVPDPAFGAILEAKFFLITIVFGTTVSRLGRMAGANPTIFAAALALSFVVFRSEIGASLIMSNYVYALTLMALFSALMSPVGQDEVEARQSALLLAILLVTCKGPIFYIAAALSFYLWWQYPPLRFSPRTMVVGVLSLLAVWSWTHVPTPYQGEEDQGFWIANPLKPRQILMIADVVGWSVPDNFKEIAVRFLGGSKPQGGGNTTAELIATYLPAIALLPYILAKYYGISAGFIYFVYRRNRLARTAMIAVSVYLVVSVLGWLFLRNGGSFRHQAHAYLLCSFLGFAALFYWAMVSRYALVLATMAALFFGFGRDVTDPFAEFLASRSSDHTVSALEKSASGLRVGTKFYVPDKTKTNWETHGDFEALSLGRRIAWQDNAPLLLYSIRPWVLCKTPVYDVESSGYQRLKECHDHPPYKY